MGEQDKILNKFGAFIASAGKGLVNYLSIIITFFLLIYSMKSSFSHWYEEINDYTEFLIPRIKDDITGNVAILLLSLLSACALYHFWGKKIVSKRRQTVFALFLAAVVMISALVLVCRLQAAPLLDSSMIITMVKQTLEGNWQCFERGQYMSNYYHQVGLFGILYFLTKYIPEGWQYYQVINCFALAGIFLLGYLITKKVWKETFTCGMYMLLQLICIPAYIYTCFIYGELLSTFLCFCTVYAVLSAGESTSVWKLALIAFFMFAGIWVRKNALIVLVALALCLIWKAIESRRFHYFSIIAALLLSLPLYKGCGNLIFSGQIERYEGIPAIAWVVMGMEKSSMGYGYFNSFATLAFEENGYDAELTKQASYREIDRIVNYYLENPKEGLKFYKEKILWQWTAPDYESLFYTKEIKNDGFLREVYYGSLRKPFWNLMNWYQNFVYFGLLCAFLFEVRKKNGGMQIIFQAIFLGYFFFSVIWEAKPRYIVMCYIMMMPMAAYGVTQFCKKINNIYKTLHRDSAGLEGKA